jgi:hypothetical protein
VFHSLQAQLRFGYWLKATPLATTLQHSKIASTANHELRT